MDSDLHSPYGAIEDAEIARRGGGIISTVKATRDASFDELEASAQKRLQLLLAGEN